MTGVTVTGSGVVWALVLPVLASVLLGLLGPGLGRRSSGRVAVRLITLTCVLVAASTFVALAGFAVVVLARVDGVATFARLSVGALPVVFQRVPIAVGLVAAVVTVALGAAGVRRVVLLCRELIRADRACRGLPVDDGVCLVDDTRPRAFAAAGLPGRVVVSTGLWAGLAPDERAAVLAHERAHLRRRHHLTLIAVRLAATADPLLRPLVAATRFAVEREADEDAAAAVGRRTVGIAVARAGLVLAAEQRRGHPAPGPTLAMGAGDVPRRVAALLAAPVAPRRWPAVPLLGLALLAAVTTVDNGIATDHHIDHARAVLAATPRHATPTTGHRGAAAL